MVERTVVSMRVPLYLQPQNKPYCGPVVAQMLLNYFGKPKSRREIVSELPMCSTGVSMYSLGSYFLAYGFRVQIIAYHNYPIFPGNFLKLKQGELKQFIGNWYDEKHTERYRATLSDFIAMGGKFSARPVTEHDIRNALRNKVGVILNINAYIAYGKKEIEHVGHYVVPIRMSKKNMTVNDPGPNWKRVTLPTERFMLACHRWSAGALFISQK